MVFIDKSVQDHAVRRQWSIVRGKEYEKIGKKRVGNAHSNLCLKYPGKSIIVIPDETRSRSGIQKSLVFFLGSPPEADSAPSGMTELIS